jgi:hypothetical protein
MHTPQFARHPEADDRIESATRALRAILALDLYPAHKRELLSVCIWKLSEAESGKYRTRYRSIASIGADAKLLAHDHVFERRKLIAQLLADPACVDQVAAQAIGCTITRNEHRRLTTLGREYPDVGGWSRYKLAGIAVIDTEHGQRLGTV